MKPLATCPSREELEQLIKGQVPYAQVEPLAQHLDQCSRCTETVLALKVDDSLVTVLREHARTLARPVDPVVTKLMERLLDLQRAAPAPTRDSSADPSRADAQAKGEVTVDLYDFLAPRQQPDELGRLAHYRVLKVLGSGGMGVVFEAEDPQLKRLVALKAMRSGLAESETARQRFLREAQAAAAIKHDHIVTIYQVGEEGGVPFLAMELLEGESLEDRLQREALLPLPEVVRIGREVAQGLAAAHKRNLLHRDIKPANLWLETPGEPGASAHGEPGASAPGGRVKIVDFGLARPNDDVHLTQSGMIVGTPAYMAPEQGRSEAVDARADLFSLGIVLYRLCTGTLPFHGKDAMGMLMAVALDTPRSVRELNPAVPPALAELVMQLLAKNPAERPQSAADVVHALKDIEATLDEPRPSGSAGAPLPDGRGSLLGRRWWVAAAAALALIGGGFLAAPIIIRITDKDGRDTRIEAPGDSNVTIEKDGKVVAQVPPRPALAPGRSPLDALQREKINAYELSMAGGGDPKQAPSSLVAVLGESRLKHWNIVRSVAFHPAGRLLASGGQDQMVRMWDIENGQQIRILRCSKTVYSVAYGPDGRHLVSGGDGELKVWDAETGRLVHDLKGHDNTINNVAFRPDGKRLASASRDQTVKVWDVEKGQLLFTLNGHTTQVMSVAYSPDGKRLASASTDRSIKLWDADQGGNELASLQGHSGGVMSVAFSPDGKYLASGGDDGTTRLWEVESRQGVRQLVKLGGDIFQLAFNSDGTQLAIGSRSGIVQLVDVRTGQVSRVFQKDSETAYSVAFSKDGRRLAAVNCNLVKVWDVTTGRLVAAPTGHHGVVTQLAGRVDGRAVASSSYDRTVRLWDLETGQQIRSIEHGGPVSSVVWAPDVMTLYSSSGSPRNEVRRLSAQTGELIRRFNIAIGITALAIRPDGKQLAAAQIDGIAKTLAVKVIDTRSGEEQHTLSFNYKFQVPLYAVVYSWDGKRLAAAYKDGPAKVWDADSGQEVCALKRLAARTRWSLAFSPDGKRLAVPGTPTTVSVRNPETGEEISELPLTNSCTVAYSPDGRYLAACNDTGKLVVFNTASGKPAHEYSLPGAVRCLLFDATSRYLLTGNGNGTIYVFRLAPPPANAGAGKPPHLPHWVEQKWIEEVSRLPAQQQVEAVTAKLRERNPGFDGTLEPRIMNGVVEEMICRTGKNIDISPLRALPGLQRLQLIEPARQRCLVADLTPLQGMQLTGLTLYGCVEVEDLAPLQGMNLTYLNLTSCIKVRDLTPLEGMPLARLLLHLCREVKDLTPLKGMKLTTLWLGNSGVCDLTPLDGMPLETLDFTPKSISKGIDVIRRMTSLKTIGTVNQQFPPEEFWKRYDAGEFTR